MNLTAPARQRLAAILTPAFSAVSAALTGWLAKHFPGLPAIPASDLTALEITGALAGAGAALKWLHGQQKLVTFTELHAHEISGEIARTPSLAEIEKLTLANRDQIVSAIENAVHAPPSVDQVVKQILAQAASAPPPVAPADPSAAPPAA